MYRDNLIGAIYASNIEDAEALVAVVESATTIEELDAVEELVQEAGGNLPGSTIPLLEGPVDGDLIRIYDMADNTESTIGKIITTLEKNKNVVIAAAAATAVIGGLAGAIAKIKSTDPKVAALKKEAKALDDEAKALKKACDSGEISEIKCKVSLLMLSKKSKAIQKKIDSLTNKGKSSVKKESVNLTVAIYEAAVNGEITGDERDRLLGLLAE